MVDQVVGSAPAAAAAAAGLGGRLREREALAHATAPAVDHRPRVAQPQHPLVPVELDPERRLCRAPSSRVSCQRVVCHVVCVSCVVSGVVWYCTCGAHEGSAEEVVRRKGRRRREHAAREVEAVEGVLLCGGLGQQQGAIVKSRTSVLCSSCVWELMLHFAVSACRVSRMRWCVFVCVCVCVRWCVRWCVCEPCAGSR